MMSRAHCEDVTRPLRRVAHAVTIARRRKREPCGNLGAAHSRRPAVRTRGRGRQRARRTAARLEGRYAAARGRHVPRHGNRRCATHERAERAVLSRERRIVLADEAVGLARLGALPGRVRARGWCHGGLAFRRARYGVPRAGPCVREPALCAVPGGRRSQERLLPGDGRLPGARRGRIAPGRMGREPAAPGHRERPSRGKLA